MHPWSLDPKPQTLKDYWNEYYTSHSPCKDLTNQWTVKCVYSIWIFADVKNRSHLFLFPPLLLHQSAHQLSALQHRLGKNSTMLRCTKHQRNTLLKDYQEVTATYLLYQWPGQPGCRWFPLQSPWSWRGLFLLMHTGLWRLVPVCGDATLI